MAGVPHGRLLLCHADGRRPSRVAAAIDAAMAPHQQPRGKGQAGAIQKEEKLARTSSVDAIAEMMRAQGRPCANSGKGAHSTPGAHCLFLNLLLSDSPVSYSPVSTVSPPTDDRCVMPIRHWPPTPALSLTLTLILSLARTHLFIGTLVGTYTYADTDSTMATDALPHLRISARLTLTTPYTDFAWAPYTDFA
eukprot:1186478-Prorocentrum_minimum.AAC.4